MGLQSLPFSRTAEDGQIFLDEQVVSGLKRKRNGYGFGPKSRRSCSPICSY